jgi:transposase
MQIGREGAKPACTGSGVRSAHQSSYRGLASAMRLRKAATSLLGWAWSPSKSPPGDRTILGKISKRGNRHLRVLFVQAAWAVLIKPRSWDRHGLKPWLEAAKRRLHHNVLAIALANKLARIAWSILAHGRTFEASKIRAA